MIFYFDSSALVKRYIEEKDSERIRRLLERETPATSRLSALEIASALNRRCREGALTRNSRDRALDQLRRDLDSTLLIEVTPQVVDEADLLLRRQALRATDALQLASCLALQNLVRARVTFVCFDDRLNEAARREGVTLDA